MSDERTHVAHDVPGPALPGPPPTELQVTWNRAIRVWWALAWRSFGFAVLLGGAMGCMIGAVVGFVGHLMGTRPDRVQLLIQFLTIPTGLVAGLLVGIWATRAVLSKQFRDFRIALIAR